MTKDGHPNRRAISAGLIAAGAFAVSRTAQSAEPSAAEKAKAFAALPDWTGVWMGVGTTLFEQKAGAAAIVTRPQALPTIKLGGGTDLKTDPLLTVQLNRFAVDFYIFSTDRFSPPHFRLGCGGRRGRRRSCCHRSRSWRGRSGGR